MGRWWRAYDYAVDDPKLGALTDKQFRAWFNLCCICSQNGGKLPPVAAAAFKLRSTPSRAKAIIAELAALRLVDLDADGVASMHDWQSWQYKTDNTDPTTASRSKRYRDRKRDAVVTEAVTHACRSRTSETETETETEKIPSLRSGARARATRLSNDWWPTQANVEYAVGKGLSIAEINLEAEKFRNFWTAKAGKDAAKLDWDATWQNWILRSVEQGKGRKNGHDRGRDESLSDIGRRLAAEARQLELAAGVGRPHDGFGGHRGGDADR